MASFQASPDGPCSCCAWRPGRSGSSPPMLAVGSDAGARVSQLTAWPGHLQGFVCLHFFLYHAMQHVLMLDWEAQQTCCV